MTGTGVALSRGSEWRQWDLHIHSPASFHWSGKRLTRDTSDTERNQLVDEMISAINAAKPAVFAIMDYWSFDGWFALKKRLLEPGAPSLKKKVFPGIELRLSAPMSGRLNAHVLFSDHVSDQELLDFRSKLIVEIVGRPLSEEALILLARQVGEDKLRKVGATKTKVDEDDWIALQTGSKIAELNAESYRAALAAVPGDRAVGFMPFDTSDGLADVKWDENYAYFLSLFRTSLIFESRNDDIRNAFLNVRTPANERFIRHFQHGLGNIPRLVVSGSDAHRFVGVAGDNDKRGYGDFPSGKITWIKSDATFEGLKQAILEPENRSYIGRSPPKKDLVDRNPDKFISEIEVTMEPAGAYNDGWLNGCRVLLNSDLVAIIGNKGSGKSALADVLALLGNSRTNHYSFLRQDRFRGKNGEPAKHFRASVRWMDGRVSSCFLSDPPRTDVPELVRYVPQGHFENLCNDHARGASKAFEDEIRSVIFSHLGDDVRLGSFDFDELVGKQESVFRARMSELRKELSEINVQIREMELLLSPDVKSSLEEQLRVAKQSLEKHIARKPIELAPPSGVFSDEQRRAAERIAAIAHELAALASSANERVEAERAVSRSVRSIVDIKGRVQLLQRSYAQFLSDVGAECDAIGVDVGRVAVLQTDITILDAKLEDARTQSENLKHKSLVGQSRVAELLAARESETVKLNAPQRQYSENAALVAAWKVRLHELQGSAEISGSMLGLEARVQVLEALPARRDSLMKKRSELCGLIFRTLDEQRESRSLLFAPLQKLIDADALVREEYQLQFRADLVASSPVLTSSLFSLVKQNHGELRGEEQSVALLESMMQACDFSVEDKVVEFAESVFRLVESSSKAASGGTGRPGVSDVLRKNRRAEEVYDLLYGLSYLETRYSLTFQGATIEQLSPGQRGALLLIFYLLVDSSSVPIVLDQPEENLDNQTVVGLLVPVLNAAKKRRQVIIVTHNPNLAVVADAEQIVRAVLDRTSDTRIEYLSGSIEDPPLNRQVVDVLEGTKPAFDNRRGKYH